MKRGVGLLAALVAVLLLVMGLLPQCARRVALSGGERDTIAPYIVRAVPPSGSTHFTGNRIRLTFNEYVALKDAQKEIYFSPPFRWPYATTLQGRTLVFDIVDTLQQDVTYRLHLGKAVQDLTENNPFVDTRYCLATGDRIDSARLVGRVRDALLHTPVAGVKVMLYTKDADSLVRSHLPNYVTVTDADGRFVFDNLPVRSFKLFALEDANANYFYDQPKERVAFSDSLVHSSSTLSDSARSYPLLNLFTYSRKPSALISATRVTPEQIRLIFSEPPEDSLSLSTLQGAPQDYVRESSRYGDTLTYWLEDATTVLSDTLQLSLRYKATVAERLEWRTDTLRLAYSFAAQKEKEVQHIRQFLADSLLRINSVWANAGVASADTLRIRVSGAVKSFDRKRFILLHDTVSLPVEVYSVSQKPREFLLKGDLKPRQRYRVRILPNAVSDTFGRTNDTTNLEVQTLNPSQFAVLHVLLRGAPQHALVQVLTADEKKTIVRSVVVPEGATRLSIPYLPPNLYTLRIVDDRNANGEWDTGNYWTHLQPEPVRYYRNDKLQSTLTLRANWEYDIDVDYQKLEE